MNERVLAVYRFVRRHVSSIAFITGFVIDSLTLTRIDLVYENFVFISYLTIAFVGILLVHAVETRRWTPKFLVHSKEWLPALVQFPLGGLFSGFVIFYTKSASLVTSWPFVALLFTLLIGNEFLRKRYERLVFQMGTFYFALLSYLVLITPVVLGTINTQTFMFAGVSSLFVMAVLTRIPKFLFTDLYTRSARAIWFVIIGITVGFNILYFTNTIPPVPLALKEIGIYHSVTRTDRGYELRYEAPPRYVFWRDTADTYHRLANEAAYCFSSVFAPTDMRTQVYHSWQKQTVSGAWERVSRIPYAIEGGRDGGYRGYSIKTNLPDGEWRCVVETEKGLVVGEVYFSVVSTDDPVPLVEKVK